MSETRQNEPLHAALTRQIPNFMRRVRSIFAPAPMADAAQEMAASDGAPTIEASETAKAVFSNGALPSNFSINLGAAPCNHSCRFCPQSVHKPKKASWLDIDLLEKVASEMPEEGVFINISSYSETLAAPNLVPAVRMLKRVRPKLRIVMASNGSLMREKVITDLIDAGLDQYNYSFDAPDRESFKRLIQVDHFDQVWKNLDRIVDLRNERKSKMLITTHILGFEEFRKSYEEFKAYWEKRVDLVSWRQFSNWGGDTWGLENQLTQAGFTIPDSEITVVRQPCTSIFMHFKLQHDGRYAPCVAAVPDYIEENEQHCVPYIGSARDMTWMEAWEKLSDMRQAHLAGEWDRYECCRSCNIWNAWPTIWEDHGAHTPERPRFHVPGIVTAD